jgi:predicted dehydrogenase
MFHTIWGGVFFLTGKISLQAAELVKSDAVGGVFAVQAVKVAAMNNTNKYFHTKWRQTPTYQGGYMLDGGVHDIAALRLILGEISSVSSFSALLKGVRNGSTIFHHRFRIGTN